MLITILGTATSQGIPVIGCDCAACTSVDPHDRRLRCSALISDDEHNVVIDVGPDFRQQMLKAQVSQLDAVLLTHEHNDHIIGLDDLRPLIFKSKKPMKIYAEDRVLSEIKKRFEYAFEEHQYPGAPKFELLSIEPGQVITVGTIQMTAIRVYHGRLPILGFRMGKLAYLTDTKQIPDESLNHLANLDYVLMDALRDQEHHSHNTVEQAIQLIHKLRPNKAGYLIHMSHLLGPVQKWSKGLPESIFAAYDGLQFEL